MKRILFIALALMLIPCMATATMTTISDIEMETVTGQRGVDLAPIDINLDLSIENTAYIDADTGTRGIAGIPNAYTGGAVNINGLSITNLHITLAGEIVDDGDATSPLDVQANPLTIDVESFDNTVPLMALRGKTSVVVGLADMHLSIDIVAIGGITLDTGALTATSAWNTETGVYEFTSPGFDPTHSLGAIEISGLTLRTYAYVEGYDAAGAPNEPNHRGQIIISAH